MEVEASVESTYLIHGIGLRLSTNSKVILDSVDQLMFPFRAPPAEVGGEELSLHLMGLDKPDDIPHLVPSGARILYRSSEKDAFDLRKLYDLSLACHFDGKVMYWDFGERGLVACDAREGEARGFVVEAERAPRSLISHWFFLHTLNDLLRARGLFPIHASCVAQEGMGVMMPGLSGSGKTTACIALVLGGFDFLSDDRSFLRRVGEGLELLAFPEGVDVTDNTVALFPELEEQLGRRKGGGKGKRSFLMDVMRPGSLVERCVPRLLLFPTVVREERSRLEPVSKAWALKQLLPQSLLVFEPEIAARQFDALSSLVEGTYSYRLHCGQDICALPELVRGVLWGG